MIGDTYRFVSATSDFSAEGERGLIDNVCVRSYYVELCSAAKLRCAPTPIIGISEDTFPEVRLKARVTHSPQVAD